MLVMESWRGPLVITWGSQEALRVGGGHRALPRLRGARALRVARAGPGGAALSTWAQVGRRRIGTQKTITYGCPYIFHVP